MNIPNAISDFLAAAPTLTLGYNELQFFKPEALEAAQSGYRFDGQGRSFITGNIGDWQEEWIVIGDDDMGDPIFADVSTPGLRIMTAPHGEGLWEPLVIADSLDNLKDIIILLQEVTRGRSTPEAFEQNPVTAAAQQAVLKEIEKRNPGSETWYWENFFDNDF